MILMYRVTKGVNPRNYLRVYIEFGGLTEGNFGNPEIIRKKQLSNAIGYF